MNNLTKNFKKYNLDIKGVRLPSFEISTEDKEKVEVSKDCSNLELLTALCYKTLKEDIKPSKSKEEYKQYLDRTEYELDMLNQLSFVDYILLVWDVINFCNKSGIATGLGRGSAAGSLVLYLIGVTRIEPIVNNLYFERFVSKARAKKKVVKGITYLDGGLMADIDLDICYYKRGEVLRYLETKFKGKTAKILTLNTLSGKLVIKECGKIVGGMEEQDVNKVSGMIPKKYGNVKDIYEAYTENTIDESGEDTGEALVPDFRNWCDDNPLVFKIACKLRGLIKNKSVHPSAVLLSYEDLEENCPTELDSSKESLVSSYDATWVSLFDVKLDILGLRGVSVVDQTLKNIQRTQGIKLSQREILGELATEENLWRHLEDLKQRHGLFHIEADTAYKVCRQVKPRNVDQLSAVLALARPGAIDFTEEYAEQINNREEKENDRQPDEAGGKKAVVHPFFDEIIEPTGGVVLYQEQLMEMAKKIGFTLDDAELLRRIVGKKKVKEVKKWKTKVTKLIKQRKLEKEIGDIFWKILEDSANYSFNKSHSISYASLSAVTVYLKFNYPKEFFLSLLQMTRHEPDPMAEIAKIQKELDCFGIKLLPPHIIESEPDFSIEGDNLRFGLSSVRGVSETTMEKINNFRPFRPDEKDKNEEAERRYQEELKDFKSVNKFEIFILAKEAGINIGVLSALIQAGALEGYASTRTRLVYEAQLWNLLTDREKEFISLNEFKLAKEKDFDLREILYYLEKEAKLYNKKGEQKSFLRDGRLKTLRKNSEKHASIFKMNKKNEALANWYYEKHFLGYSYFTTLRTLFKTDSDIRDVEESMLDRKVRFVGWVEESINKKSQAGNRYNQTITTDERGEMRTMIFNKKKDQCEENNARLPKKGDIVIIKGTKKDGVVFADSIEIAPVKIYTKLSELKK